jgi:hypothetical protein
MNTEVTIPIVINVLTVHQDMSLMKITLDAYQSSQNVAALKDSKKTSGAVYHAQMDGFQWMISLYVYLLHTAPLPLNTWVTRAPVTNARLADTVTLQLPIRSHATEASQFVTALKDSEVTFGIVRNAQQDKYQILTEQDVWNHQPAEV